MSSSHPQMPPGFQAANIHPPPPPNFDKEQAYWQPRLDVINNILAGIPSVRHEDLTEAQARTESFALANIDQYIKEMNDKRAPGSDFYQAKFLHLCALLVRSYLARDDELLGEAERVYNRVLVNYGSEDEDDIKETGEELNLIRQDYICMKRGLGCTMMPRYITQTHVITLLLRKRLLRSRNSCKSEEKVDADDDGDVGAAIVLQFFYFCQDQFQVYLCLQSFGPICLLVTSICFYLCLDEHDW